MNLIDREKVKKLEKIIREASGRIILLIDHMDPDSFGAVPAVIAMLEKVKSNGVKIRAYHGGEPGRLQNQIIFEKYHLHRYMRPIAELQKVNEDDIVILLDSPTAMNSRVPLEVQEIIREKIKVIIDHHETAGPEEGEDQVFLFETAGSTCTIITELIQNEPFVIEFSEDSGNRYLAELLALGISTDTRKLDNASQRDVDAYQYVHQFCDTKDLSRLKKISRTPSQFRLSGLAYENTDKSKENDRWLVSLGILQSKKEIDDLAFIADEFISYKNCNQVLVHGIFQGSAILTARSKEGNEPLDPLLKKKFGKDSAGGKLTPIGDGEGGGRYELDLGEFGSKVDWENEDQKQVMELAVRTVLRGNWFKD